MCETANLTRQVHRTIFGFNHATAEDDIRMLSQTASWAVLHGMPDELSPRVLPKAKEMARKMEMEAA